jgi:hypothetical protein
VSGLWAWCVKLVGGWIPIGTKPFPEYVGKILWAVGIYIVCAIVLNHFFPNKPSVTTIGQGGTQIIYQDQRDTMGIGCNMWRGYIKGGIKPK